MVTWLSSDLLKGCVMLSKLITILEVGLQAFPLFLISITERNTHNQADENNLLLTPC